MKKLLISIILLLALLFTLSGCDAADPLRDDLYTLGDIYIWDGAAWVPVTAGGIAPTIFDAKGDLLTATGNDAPVILSVGADTFVLTANSAVANGIEWAAGAGGEWTADVNGIHYSLGSVGVNTNSSATELLSLWSNDGIANSPVLFVGDMSASVDSIGIRVNMSGAKTDYTDGIYITNASTTATAGSEKFGVRIRNTGNWLGVGSVNYGLYIEEPTGGTSNVGIWNDGTTILNDIITFNEQLVLAGDGKGWIELRPELDFDIIKKRGVPDSYERGVFAGFELPIYAADFQELIFEICVPDRWDGASIVHVHLDVYVIGAQDDGDAFRMQIDYEHYNGGVDVVPATSTPIEVETETGASAAFQSYHIHFDIPAGDMLGDDILAFRVRRIDVEDGVEIDGNLVFNHAGVIFLCDKLGNVEAE